MKFGSYKVVVSGRPDFYFGGAIESHDLAEQVSLKVDGPVKVQKLAKHSAAYLGEYSTVATYRSGKEVEEVEK